MRKASISRTHGPIHFEDLDPHRFEDLVRKLAYDFRDWLTIEATGRSGSDDGFDIRAFERAEDGPRTSSTEYDDDDVPYHPMEGRVWKFQCKREKRVGPKKLTSILSAGVDPENPPYAYVLAAPANFSKAAYDVFRAELRKRGVMEFYLWGRAELEDMLHQPKNDHVLFTFFGISLISRRKSRATELRALISVKNRLQKLLTKEPASQPVLLRDSKDVHYPDSEGYSDFDRYPRWMELPVVEIHPLGLICEFAEHFAVYDAARKTWDYTPAINLSTSRGSQGFNHDRDQFGRVEAFLESFPRRQRAKLVDLRFVRFDSVVAVDGDGDTWFEVPHVYIDFDAEKGPFSQERRFLRLDHRQLEDVEGLKRVDLFPSKFPAPSIGKVHRDRAVELCLEARKRTENYSTSDYTLYDCDGTLGFLNRDDVVGVAGMEEADGDPVLIKITCLWSEAGKDLLRDKPVDRLRISRIEEQLGRELTSEDVVNVYEFRRLHQWELQEEK